MLSPFLYCRCLHFKVIVVLNSLLYCQCLHFKVIVMLNPFLYCRCLHFKAIVILSPFLYCRCLHFKVIVILSPFLYCRCLHFKVIVMLSLFLYCRCLHFKAIMLKPFLQIIHVFTPHSCVAGYPCLYTHVAVQYPIPSLYGISLQPSFKGILMLNQFLYRIRVFTPGQFCIAGYSCRFHRPSRC